MQFLYKWLLKKKLVSNSLISLKTKTDNQYDQRKMFQRFQQSRINSTFCVFRGGYNNLVCQENLPLDQMLLNIFETTVRAFFEYIFWQQRTSFTCLRHISDGRCNWSTEDSFFLLGTWSQLRCIQGSVFTQFLRFF
jgi:hypothetical protein